MVGYGSQNTNSLTVGETYTIRPYIYLTDETQKIYGETKTVTIAMPSDVITAYSNKVSSHVTLNGDSSKNFCVKFTQPEDAESKTYIDVGGVLTHVSSVYDENGIYIRSYSENGRYYYELTAGVTYYVTCYSYYDGTATMQISSLSESGEPEAAAISGASVTFSITGDVPTGTVLYAAFYDSEGKLLTIETIQNPTADSHTVTAADKKTFSYKLMLIKSDSFMPLCGALEGTITAQSTDTGTSSGGTASFE